LKSIRWHEKAAGQPSDRVAGQHRADSRGKVPNSVKLPLFLPVIIRIFSTCHGFGGLFALSRTIFLGKNFSALSQSINSVHAIGAGKIGRHLEKLRDLLRHSAMGAIHIDAHIEGRYEIEDGHLSQSSTGVVAIGGRPKKIDLCLKKSAPELQ